MSSPAPTGKNRVLRSIETGDGARCVDIFVRPDATFGFEECRRDVEDARGWFPLSHTSLQVYATEEAVLVAAQSRVPWLTQVLHQGR
jgi:hypothetical protein